MDEGEAGMIGVQRPGLIERIQHVADETNRDATQVVEEAVQVYLDRLEQDKIHQETEAFRANQAELATRYAGEYVAMHQGRVVDHDPDVGRLEQRVAARFGETAVLIAPVTDDARRDLSTVSFRLDPPTEVAP
jgi:predicted transcriptional regulator